MEITVLIIVHHTLRNTGSIIKLLKEVSPPNWELNFCIINTDRGLDESVDSLCENTDLTKIKHEKYPDIMWAEALQNFIVENEERKNILHVNSDVELNYSALKHELFYIDKCFSDKIFYVGLISSESGEMYGFKKYKNNHFEKSDFEDFTVFNFNFVLFKNERIKSLLPKKPFKQAFLDYYISMQTSQEDVLQPKRIVGIDKNPQNKFKVNKNSVFYKSRVNIADSFRFYSAFRSVPYAMMLSVYLGVFK